jgi:hypothetical protein
VTQQALSLLNQLTAHSVVQPLPLATVTEWVEFMKGNGIKRVISLLSPSELETYAEPLREAMLKVW